MNDPGLSRFASSDRGPRDGFHTTCWTVVVQAGNRPSAEADAALDALCRIYWYPLYAYVRRRGHAKEDAEDLTQAFFASLLARNDLVRLTRERGRFRAFLLAALKHFLANAWDRTQRQKRGGGQILLSLDWQEADDRFRIEPADPLSPDTLYDRAWGMTLLERVMERLREEYAAAGRAVLFDALKPFLAMGGASIPYVRVAEPLGMTEGAARVATHRLRRRYRNILREEIAQTVADPAQLDDEIRALFAAFAQ